MAHKIVLTPQQQQRADELKNMNPQQWDSVCKQCGLCCLIKMDFEMGKPAFFDLCCEKFDCETKKCRVYKNRIADQQGLCEKVTLDLILEDELLPRTCGYVEYIFGPSPKPINVDFSKIKPVSNDKARRMNILEAITHILPGSSNWHVR